MIGHAVERTAWPRCRFVFVPDPGGGWSCFNPDWIDDPLSRILPNDTGYLYTRLFPRRYCTVLRRRYRVYTPINAVACNGLQFLPKMIKCPSTLTVLGFSADVPG